MGGGLGADTTAVTKPRGQGPVWKGWPDQSQHLDPTTKTLWEGKRGIQEGSASLTERRGRCRLHPVPSTPCVP